MAPILQCFGLEKKKKVLLLSLALFLFCSFLLCALAASEQNLNGSNGFRSRRRLLGDEQTNEDKSKKKLSTDTFSAKKNQTKLIKSNLNSTKILFKKLNSTKIQFKKLNSTKIQFKKLNSTSKSFLSKNSTSLSAKPLLKKLNSTSKATNSTKPASLLTRKASDLRKSTQPKNKTIISKSNGGTEPAKKNLLDTQIKKKVEDTKTKKPKPSPSIASAEDEDDDGDLIAGFRDLPFKFQQTVLPDFDKISITSKAYIAKANRQLTKGIKPLVGNKYASTIAAIVSFAFIIIPLILVSLIVNRIKAYFSLQKVLIFVQIYLSIYFSILCLSSLVTGLEPLKFFYATSTTTYIFLQVMQTLAYVFYLLLLLMYLVLVFSTESWLGSKMLGLGQTFVGFAVGLHYYTAVFHRMVLHQPPKTNWKVHGVYATCFLVICLIANAERRKKAYLEEGGEEGKKN